MAHKTMSLQLQSPPATINVSDVVKGNHNNHQADTANQTNQGGINPGTVICNVMPSTSACSTNTSNGACQDEIVVNGTTHCSVNAAVHLCVS